MNGSALAELLAADPVEVAPRLLGKVLVAQVGAVAPPGGPAAGAGTGSLAAGAVSGRIVEVEAYRGEDDPASHAFRGPTARSRVMFGPPGLLYVYLSYGMHHCCNVVCWPEGRPGAVLIRALRPLTGLEAMRARRPQASRDRDLCSGPGKLCQALGIDRSANGTDLLAGGGPVRLVDDGFTVTGIASGPRIGIGPQLPTAGEPWRFFVSGDENVSRPGAQSPLAASRSTTS